MILSKPKKRQYPERVEQKKVVQFLWLQKEYGNVLEYTATAQATYTGWGQISVNKQLGVQRGLPDLIIVLPPKDNGYNRLVFIEMKHPGASDSDVRPEQRSWIKALNSVGAGVYAIVAKSGEQAIQYLTSLMKSTEPHQDGQTFEQFLSTKQ